MKNYFKSFISPLALALLSLTSATAFGTVYDLSTQSAVAISTSYGTAIFTADFTQPTGTGVFDPFLSIQANGIEKGYNSSAGVFDTKRESQWNHEITIGDLAQSKVTIGGADYYSFTIDINEPNAGDKSQISLDSLKIYLSGKADQTTANVDNLGSKVFDLDLPADNYLLYDDINSGSGQSDIAFFIPTAAFAGASSSSYVYMFQQFGAYKAADYDAVSQGGFEETRIAVGVRPVPEPSALIPLAGLLGVACFSRRLTRQSANAQSKAA